MPSAAIISWSSSRTSLECVRSRPRQASSSSAASCPSFVRPGNLLPRCVVGALCVPTTLPRTGCRIRRRQISSFANELSRLGRLSMTAKPSRRTLLTAAVAAVPAAALLSGPASAAAAAPSTDLPDFAPVPAAALGPALNADGYYVGRIKGDLHWVTDGFYQA